MKIGIEHPFTTAGQEMSLETGKLAKQADGSVVVKQGDTYLLATVVANQEASEGVDFLPLTIEYREKFSSTGKFPGGFIKREARPSETEILTARLIDRALRPLFPDDFHAETQVFVQLISSDKNTMPDALACLAASAALAVSDIPFNGPVSEVRVGRLNGELVINPTLSDLANSDIDMIIAGTESHIVMVEGEMDEISEEEMVETILFAHEAIKEQCKAINELAAQVPSSQPKREYNHEPTNPELETAMHDACYQKLYDIAKSPTAKQERGAQFEQVFADFVETMSEEEVEENSFLLKKYFKQTKKKAVRDLVLNENIRLDGRQTNNIRDIWCEVDYLPGTHGSAIFTRGETQSLTSITLGTKLDEQTLDGAFISDKLRFMLHYNFPPFSTGEARPIRSTSRREIGHGNLAMRALKAMVPSDYPYTVRVLSDILESNGSSSMATVCAGSLALMDAGVPIQKQVSGIAMGLITEGDDRYAVLSDILGDEDALGDMDFKVAGTIDGITACQMDIKVAGLTEEVLRTALNQAREGRHHILGVMNATISQPNDDLKPHAPRIQELRIPKDMIGAVIGPGGKIIQEIQNETETTIVIEEVENEGVVTIAATSGESMDLAVARVKAIVAVPEIDETYMGKVKALAPYGAFVEILPGKDGLLHISEIDWKRIERVEDVMKEGDQLKVKVIGIDQKTGKIKLSRKVLLPKPERNPAS